MPTEPSRNRDTAREYETPHEDDPIPRASEDDVLEETARLAREGRKNLEADPRESKPQDT